MGDTHLYHDDLRRIPDGDVFVHVGDLLQGGTVNELRRTADWWSALPHARKLFCAGQP